MILVYSMTYTARHGGPWRRGETNVLVPTPCHRTETYLWGNCGDMEA